jgi:polysaccharide deacetylase 2 family uncharacterized protein YibQ
MSLRNFYILIAFIVIVAINYLTFNIIFNKKQERIIKPSVLQVDNKINININQDKQIEKEIEIKKEDKPIQKEVQKPLFAIIIDDVSFPNHLRYIDMVDITLNLSFLPPTSRHKESHLLASDYDKYMVHLPLNADSYHASEVGTLQDNSSYKEIDRKIKLIRSLFPKAKYINNHTGSKFTANLKAMRKLSIALDKYNFIFVDSKTTSKTQASKAFSYDVLVRDVFLDNKDNINYIKRQIKQAVDRAVNKGYAIAIGHPKYNTLKAIKEMSNYIQKYTKIVYIDELDNALHKK